MHVYDYRCQDNPFKLVPGQTLISRIRELLQSCRYNSDQSWECTELIKTVQPWWTFPIIIVNVNVVLYVICTLVLNERGGVRSGDSEDNDKEDSGGNSSYEFSFWFECVYYKDG